MAWCLRCISWWNEYALLDSRSTGEKIAHRQTPVLDLRSITCVLLVSVGLRAWLMHKRVWFWFIRNWIVSSSLVVSTTHMYSVANQWVQIMNYQLNILHWKRNVLEGSWTFRHNYDIDLILQHRTVLRQGRVPIPQSRDLQEGIQKECQEHAEQEQSDLEWSGVTLEWKEVDNKSGETALASARVLCLDLLSCVWLHILGELKCCQEFRKGVVY